MVMLCQPSHSSLHGLLLLNACRYHNRSVASQVACQLGNLTAAQPDDCLQVRCTSVCCFALAPSSPDQGCFARSCSTKLSFMLKGPRAGCRILNETSWLAGYCCIMHFSGDVFSPFCIMLLSELCYTSGSKPDNLSQTYPCLLFVSH